MQAYPHMILLYFTILLICALLVFPSFCPPFEYGISVEAAAQRITSPDLTKVLVDNAIQTLQSGNINKTIAHLRAVEMELSLAFTDNNDHNYSIQSSSMLLLVKDVIQSLENNDGSKALVYLNLADQQLGRSLLNIPNANLTGTIPSGTYLTYTNYKYGIKVQYPYNWIVEGNSYATGAGGIQIASFYLPGVNNGLPFFRIGVDNVSKEFPRLPVVGINEYLDRSLEHKNSTGFPGFKLVENSTNNTLAGNRAYAVVWTYTHPMYGIRKSIEIATVIGSKGYFVDYTAADANFSKFLPVAEKMIKSFQKIK
jgi:hypothetical protein